MITYECGCANLIDDESGVMKRAVRCETHEAELRSTVVDELSYYVPHGTVTEDGVILCDKHERELKSALDHMQLDLKTERPRALALEVGCGASPYVPLLRRLGYAYIGIDHMRHGLDLTAKTYAVPTRHCKFEQFYHHRTFDLMLACHVFEHMRDGPDMIRKAARMLEPGGWLLGIVPDDRDPVNPDHMWFFTEPTIRACLMTAGLEDVRTCTQKIVPQEDFVYFAARRPGR